MHTTDGDLGENIPLEAGAFLLALHVIHLLVFLYMQTGAELFGLTLMHGHQGQIIFLGVTMGIICCVHQVRLEEVHQEDHNSSSQGIIPKSASGKF
jgi:hypothetical protein